MKNINLQAKIFKFKDIILKPIDTECWEYFYKHSSNRKVFKFMDLSFVSKKEIFKYLQNLIKKSKNKNFQTWQVIFKSNFCGTITLRYPKLKPWELEMAYAISAEACIHPTYIHDILTKLKKKEDIIKAIMVLLCSETPKLVYEK